MELTIIGNSAALPAHGRITTCQVLRTRGGLMMFDCGEFAQQRIGEHGVKRGDLNHIFITHMHGDHVLGLVGMITSYCLLGRKHELHLYGPPALERFVKTQLECTESYLTFELLFHVVWLDEHLLVYQDQYVTVHSIPLKHRIATCGFLVREKPQPRKMLAEKIALYNIPFTAINGIKSGNDFVMPDGTIIPNDTLTLPPNASKAFAFCTDTAYLPSIVPLLEGVDLLYHEATFLHEMEEHATIAFHSTALQAAQIALDARVGKLLIGHFSSRYLDLSPLLEEARSVFPETYLAIEGEKWLI